VSPLSIIPPVALRRRRGRNGIVGTGLHPGCATQNAFRRQPKPARQTIRPHRIH
jgi:hypothetical protein